MGKDTLCRALHHVKDFNLYLKISENHLRVFFFIFYFFYFFFPLKGFKQEVYMIKFMFSKKKTNKFMFSKDHCGCRTQNWRETLWMPEAQKLGSCSNR